MKKKLIERVTVGSGGAASITFSAIAADWTDLVVKLSSRSSRADTVDSAFIALNGSSSNFTHRRLLGSGSSASSSSASNGQILLNSAGSNTPNTFGNAEFCIPNYQSTAAKSISTDSVTETNATEAYQAIYASLWNPSPNVAVTSITLTCGNGNFVEHSSASLYGIVRGSDGTTTVS